MMKKLIVVMLCMATTLVMGAYGTFAGPQEKNPIIGDDPATWGPTEQEKTPIIGDDPATWGPTEYETLAEAIKACGFDFSVPDTVSEYKNKLFTVFNDGLIQVIYFNEDSGSLLIRKAAGNGDISGDYNDYPETNTISVNNLEVTTRGSDGKVNVAIWTDNGYTFAVTTNHPVDMELLSELIERVK